MVNFISIINVIKHRKEIVQKKEKRILKIKTLEIRVSKAIYFMEKKAIAKHFFFYGKQSYSKVIYFMENKVMRKPHEAMLRLEKPFVSSRILYGKLTTASC